MTTTIGIIIRKLFGLLAVLIGGSIFIWILYNVFIERQNGFNWSWLLGFGVALPIINVGVYWLKTGSSKDKDYHEWKNENK